MKTRYGAFIALLITLAACQRAGESEDKLVGLAAIYPNVDQHILAPHCLRCHAGPGETGVDVSSLRSLLDSGLVVPGKPDESALFLSVVGGRMPKGGPKLKANEIAFLRVWIGAGAPEGKPPTPPPPPTPTHAWIQSQVFNTRCIGCHDGKHEKTKLDLRTYESLMGFVGEILNAVEPGDPEFSGLFRSLDQGTMPPAGEKISREAIEAVRVWIAEGAKK